MSFIHDSIEIPAEARNEVCRHCRAWRSQHPDSKCLFDTTDFAPMSVEEFQLYVTDLLEPLVNWFNEPTRYVGCGPTSPCPHSPTSQS